MFRSEGLEVERLPANWVGTAARLLAYFRLSCLLIDVGFRLLEQSYRCYVYRILGSK